MQLPTPDPDAAAASAQLLQSIAGSIAAAGGFLPFERYMHEALYAPGLGYYAAGAAKFGAAGDFITAPGTSALFGATLARQVAEVTRASSPQVLEFGAGTGRLAADLLNTLDQDCRIYSILEPSPELRARQSTLLREAASEHWHKVRWLEAMPARFSGCIIANEVLDAMPVHLLHLHDGLIEQRGVILDAQGRLAFADRPADATLMREASALDIAVGPDGYVTELGLAARAWTATLDEVLQHGVAILIDYGFPAAEYYHPQRSNGTLMCHYRHIAHHDPLLYPGLTDLTAHVDFSAVAAAAQAAGLDVLGYTSQANFLINCGIADLIAKTSPQDSQAYLPLTNQANRLLSPAEMGELFKVLAIGRGIDFELSGFARGDRSQAL